jgi:hypothetical protein
MDYALFTAVVNCVDTDLDESEEAFESEFNKRYGDQASEKKAAAALAAAEKQVHNLT